LRFLSLMLTHQFLSWDSEFLGFPTAKINITKTATPDELLLFIKKLQYRLVYIFDPHHYLSKFVYEDNSFYLTDTKVIYKKSLLFYQDISVAQISIKEYSTSVISEDLYSLAILAGRYSRFAQDKRLDKTVFEKLYRTWIENSVNGQFANKVWVAYHGAQAVGLVTVAIEENTATIGLIAVAETHQRLGIGKALLQTVENWCLTLPAISFMKVATQLQNSSACSFYEKLGFDVELVVPIYHAWNI